MQEHLKFLKKECKPVKSNKQMTSAELKKLGLHKVILMNYYLTCQLNLKLNLKML